jgi:hypothetical protein
VRDDMLATVTHDPRTPLSAIVTASALQVAAGAGLALDPDVSAVRADDLFRDREAEARPLVALLLHAAALISI